MSGLRVRYGQAIQEIARLARQGKYCEAQAILPRLGQSGSAYANAGSAMLQRHIDDVLKLGISFIPLPPAHCQRGERFRNDFIECYNNSQPH